MSGMHCTRGGNGVSGVRGVLGVSGKNKVRVILTMGLIIAVMLISMAGCDVNGNNNGNGNTSANDSSPTSSASSDAASQSETSNDGTGVTGQTMEDGNVGIPGPDGKLLYYGFGGIAEYTDGKNPGIVYVKDSDGSVVTVCEDLSSKPVLSPDGKRLAYLSPFEWEVIGDLWIFDLETGLNSPLIGGADPQQTKYIRKDNTPKHILWLDDKHILVIFQFGFGTVAQGGNLYVYDLADGTFMPLTKLYDREQLTGMILDSNYLYLDAIEFTDDTYNEFQKFKRFIPRDELYNAAMNYRLVFPRYGGDEDIKGYEDYLAQVGALELDTAKAFTEADADLDGDGDKEQVRLQMKNQSEYVLTVNDSKMTGFGENFEDKVYIVDIDKSDKYKEVAVQELGPSDDYVTHFYSYDDKEGLRLIGELQGLCANTESIKGNGIVTATERAIMLQTWFYDTEYKLDPDRMLRGVKSDLYPISYESQTLTVLVEMHLYAAPEDPDPAITLKPGDTIKMLGCDAIEWCMAETASGEKGWFAVDLFNVREVGMEVSEVFEGLSFAD